jgi:hypothetical protein
MQLVAEESQKLKRNWSTGKALIACRSCGSENQTEFGAEMLIYFSGLKNLDKSAVWVFPNGTRVKFSDNQSGNRCFPAADRVFLSRYLRRW